MAKITRRELLKTGAVGAGLLTLNQAVAALVDAQEPVNGGRSISRTTGGLRHPIPSTCLMCQARCGIICLP